MLAPSLRAWRARRATGCVNDANAASRRRRVVVAHDLGAGVPDRFDEADARASAGWPSRDLVMDWGTSLRRMRHRHYNFAYLAPMALLPIGIDDKVDLLLGQLD